MTAWREDERLARHTAWRTGGPCGAFVVVHRRESLSEVMNEGRERYGNVHVLGAGTRTLARDGGTAAAVVRLGTDFARIERTGATLRVGAAVPVPALVAACRGWDLAGVEQQDAIGSVGASVLLDSGWDAIGTVSLLVRGREREVPVAEARGAKNPVITGVTLHLVPDGAEAIARRTTAPRPAVWKAPRRASLRDLLDHAHLPGVRLRDVHIPSVAPELLVNAGCAPARDLVLLHTAATERVARETGVDLRPNLHFLGRA
jgi:UDP-N-acetylmuramate dehydrogenase